MSTALINGRIYTVDPATPWAAAVLIENGIFTVVGSNEEVRAAAPDETEFVDLGGRMAMPGLHDAHTHLLFSGLKFGTRPACPRLAPQPRSCTICTTVGAPNWSTKGLHPG